MLHIFGLFVELLSPLFEHWSDYRYRAIGYLRSRYYRKRLRKCGDNLTVNGKPLLFELNKISIGNHVTINNGVQISPRGSVTIDDYVVMSRGSQIIAGQLDTSKWVEEGYKGVPHVGLDVHIGEGCWLCVNSVVLPGVNITGKGVIVAAGAVVNRDITEDYVVVAGVPATIVKKLEKQDESE